ncbi:NAD-dependent epimerase [Paenibacillus koleovorans]|uniref:NAD-dependent epimerase n=1 Tax=Paenibacillus koleovorans TaxID=121608 RepID=UPI000FDA4895|nr:NAD-dependent epimerase [Paenibacillus koleovorans]
MITNLSSSHSKKILVTGCAGFIGYHLASRLLEIGFQVVGLDNMNDYYDAAIKQARLGLLQQNRRFSFHRIGLENRSELERIFAENDPFDAVVNLAAQAGVRYSLVNPHAYTDANLVGFVNLLEACRAAEVGHLLFASSSSVYGSNTMMPFDVHHPADHPLSLYAATKKANELMAHSYSHLFSLPVTGLRFFTVYGPWGRPDMATYLFADRIMKGQPIQVFNHGRMKRDFTYVDDIVEGVVRLIDRPPVPNPSWDRQNPDPATSHAPYRLYNIGHNEPVELMRVIRLLEQYLGKEAKLEFQPIQPGDVEATYADIDDLTATVGFKPSVSIEEGLRRFVDWYLSYHHNYSG